MNASTFSAYKRIPLWRLFMIGLTGSLLVRFVRGKEKGPRKSFIRSFITTYLAGRMARRGIDSLNSGKGQGKPSAYRRSSGRKQKVK